MCIGDANTTHTLDGFGRKFIGVAKDGVLELHGQSKTSWTKLAGTVDAISGDDIIFQDKAC